MMTVAQLKIFEDAVYRLLTALKPLHKDVEVKLIVDRNTKIMVDNIASAQRFGRPSIFIGFHLDGRVKHICGVEIVTSEDHDDSKNS